MIEYSKVAQQFAVFAGLEQSSAEKWTFLCTAAADELDRIVAEDADRVLWNDRLIMAAAALAYYRYALVCSCEGTDFDLKIGDLSLASDAASLENALKLKDEFLVMVRPVLKAQDTVLIQVG